MEIYPAIDLKDGQCVRLLRGDFGTVHTVAADPAAVALSYREAGAEVVHLVDLDGAKDGVRKNAALVENIANTAKPSAIELGGGLRGMDDLAQADKLGAGRFVIGSAAVENPGFVKEAVARYGKRVAVGMDAQGGRVRTHGWTGDSGICELDFAREVASWGVSVLIYTDIETDGTLEGPSLERLKALRGALPDVFLVASGGVSCVDDIKALRRLGIDAAIVGKALYTGDVPLESALLEARWGHLFDKAALIPAIIQDAATKDVLMLGYMSQEAFGLTLKTKKATFYSRSRDCIWVKGETSGNFLNVTGIRADCDNDTLLLSCRPNGPVCHTGSQNCFFNAISEDEHNV